MKLVYVGPFSRFAFRVEDSQVAIFDAESRAPHIAVAHAANEAEARQYIEARIAADPSMQEIGE